MFQSPDIGCRLSIVVSRDMFRLPPMSFTCTERKTSQGLSISLKGILLNKEMGFYENLSQVGDPFPPGWEFLVHKKVCSICIFFI